MILFTSLEVAFCNLKWMVFEANVILRSQIVISKAYQLIVITIYSLLRWSQYATT